MFGPVNGVLKIRDSSQPVALVYDFQTDGDMTVEATFYNPEGYSFGYGLLFRTNTGDSYSYFMFEVGGNIYHTGARRWQLVQGMAGESYQTMASNGGPSDAVNDGAGESNHLKVEVVNDQVVRLSINGMAVHDAASLSYPQDQYYDISEWPSSGYVGVVTGFSEWDRETGTDIYYENFRATND